MRNPRTYVFLVMALGAILGLAGRSWLDTRVASGDSPTGALAAQPDRIDGAHREVAFAAGEPLDHPVPARPPPKMEPLELSSDDNLLVAEMCDLQLMAQGTNLALDSTQWSSLAAVVLRTQAIRHAFEAQIATSQKIAPDRYRMEIPSYADAGEVLREKFVAELTAKLGEPAAKEVMAKLGGALEGRFAGFGVSVQTLEITASPGGEPSDSQIVRTAEYWNRVENTERVATRREVHFPFLEDPTGDTWGALLAMTSAAGTENGPG